MGTGEKHETTLSQSPATHFRTFHAEIACAGDPPEAGKMLPIIAAFAGVVQW